MRIGRVFIALHTDVNRRRDPLAMQSLDLLAKQIQPPGQAGMPLRSGGVVIKMSVMTLGKDGNAVDVRRLHRRGKPLRVECRPHIRDRRTGMKIKMNLPRAKLEH